MEQQFIEEEYPQMPYPPQPMPGPASDTMYADIVQERKMSNILDKINPDNLLADIEARIKGLRKDVYTNQWVKISDAPEISPRLIGNFMSFLSCVLYNDVTFSNYKDVEINKIMKMVIQYYVDDITSNAREYGVENNYTERTRIGLIICMTVFATLKRAQNGLEAQRIFRNMKIGESNSLSEGSKKGGVMDALKFWK
jgi:hypothetical protein